MKRFSEQLKKKSDTIRLRVTERADLRARLESYMEYHPLPSEMKVSTKTTQKTPKKAKVQGIVSEPFTVIKLNLTYVRSAIGAFAVLVIVTVPVLAERSVPGDVLYPVKTNINEEVRSSLTLSPYAKIEWETKRLERRVAEARLLASEGKLTPETEAVVAQAVKEHTEAVTQGIATIRETNEDDAAIAEIAFASTLSVQADALQEYAESDPIDTSDSNTSQEGHSVSILVDALNDASDDAENAQEDAAPSYEALLAQVESQTTQAYEIFASITKQAQEAEKEDIQRRLDDIERKLAEAIALYTQKDALEISQVATQEPGMGASQTDTIDEEEVVVSAPVDTEATTTVFAETEESTEADQEEVTSDNVLSQQLEEVVPLSMEERQQKAVASLRMLLSDLQKLIIFMTDIDVRTSLSVEDVVPVSLSAEEQITNINNTLDNIAQMQERIGTQKKGENIAEKVTYGLEVVTERVESAIVARDTGAYQQAQQLADEAYAMIVDIDQMVAQQEDDTSVPADTSGEPISEESVNNQIDMESNQESSTINNKEEPDTEDDATSDMQNENESIPSLTPKRETENQN